MSLNIRGRLLSLERPLVMGIVNATDDSFAFSCSHISEAEVLTVAARAVQEGADIVDVGGCSTRPGSKPVDAAEEWRRLEIALCAIRGAYPEAVLSVDTFRAEIARKAVEKYGVGIINDVSGGSEEMFGTVADLGVAYVLTHNAPLTDERPVSVQVLEFLVRKSDELHRMGVNDVIGDAGFGFNKTEAQNYALLRDLGDLRHTGLPLLVGLSRKSMFYKPLGVTPDSDTALAATIAADTLALQSGAKILRVHDVSAAVATIRVMSSV